MRGEVDGSRSWGKEALWSPDLIRMSALSQWARRPLRPAGSARPVDSQVGAEVLGKQAQVDGAHGA